MGHLSQSGGRLQTAAAVQRQCQPTKFHLLAGKRKVPRTLFEGILHSEARSLFRSSESRGAESGRIGAPAAAAKSLFCSKLDCADEDEERPGAKGRWRGQ